MKKTVFILASILCGMLCLGHEFWLQPHKFFYYIRETANIRFLVGEDFDGKNWQGNRNKVKTLYHYSPDDAVTDIANVLSNENGDSLKIPLKINGTHLIAFNSTNTYIELEAEKFNQYLQEDGLLLAQEIRKSNNETQNTGKEYYQRCAKTLLQVGNEITDRCLSPTGLPLEIVPLQNPYHTPQHYRRAELPKVQFKVLYKGNPKKDILVKIWYQSPDKQTKMEQFITNKKGIITASWQPGPFMVSCVYMERLSNDPKADWQSYWASLSFEYSQFFPKTNPQ